MSASIEQQVSSTVAAWLGANGHKQQWLGDRLGLGQPAVSDRLRNKTPWSLSDLQRIGEAFNVPPWYFTMGIAPDTHDRAERLARETVQDMRDFRFPDNDDRAAHAAYTDLGRKAALALDFGNLPRSVELARAAALCWAATRGAAAFVNGDDTARQPADDDKIMTEPVTARIPA
jgi:transcriptional regulator with XRE-family HTH domain